MSSEMKTFLANYPETITIKVDVYEKGEEKLILLSID
jgi:hypothetical protein